MTKIVAFFEIFILLTCAVYLVIRVAKAITQKKPRFLAAACRNPHRHCML